MERDRGVDGRTLKLIAAAVMLTDHVGAILLPQALWLRCVGRLAFPIFAFFIAEGYISTHDFKRYFLRMAAFAAAAEIPFDLEGGRIFDPSGQNVLWTFCIALLTLRAMDTLRQENGWKKYVGMTAAAAAGWAAGELLAVDYGGWGVATVVLFFLCREGKYAKLCLALGMAVLNGLCIGSRTVPIFGVEVPIQVLAVAALPLLRLYNGKPGRKGWRWVFYVFYPAHLLALEGIRALMT